MKSQLSYKIRTSNSYALPVIRYPTCIITCLKEETEDGLLSVKGNTHYETSKFQEYIRQHNHGSTGTGTQHKTNRGQGQPIHRTPAVDFAKTPRYTVYS